MAAEVVFRLIIFNIVGIVMLAACFGLAFGVGSFLGLQGEGPLMVIAGPLLLVCDIGYRMRAATPSWFRQTQGGSLFFLPVWLWGAIWSVLGVIYVFQGN